MKINQRVVLVSMALVSFLFLGNVHAEDKTTTIQSQEENHPAGHDMMGSMNMDAMKGMMQECMQMHKDSKMCDNQTMEKCQEKMGKAECKKMMKHANATNKATKTK